MAKRSHPLFAAVLAPRTVRVMSAAVFASALAMPWLAWWAGAFGEAQEIKVTERIVEYRPALVALPGGKFMMGSTVEEQDRAIAEAVKAGTEATVAERMYRGEMRHEAEVGEFEVCVTEVTQGQWKVVMGVEELREEECGNEACEDEKPITGVSWFKAVEYMNRLTDKENEQRAGEEQRTRCYEELSEYAVRWDRDCTGYRLPTEAEWEYAARAGSETVYFFGDDPTKLCAHGNEAALAGEAMYEAWDMVECGDKVADPLARIGTDPLARIGSYPPNAWGVYDTHGNAWEWVWDRSGDYSQKPPKNYTGPRDSLMRVLRGGTFGVVSGCLRSAYRGRGIAKCSYRVSGLRCARGPHSQP